MSTIARSTILIAGLLALAQPAAAAVQSVQLTLEASGFADVSGMVAAATDPYRLSVRLTFDPGASDQFDNASGVVLVSASRPVTGGLVFDYDRSLDELTLGGALLGAAGLAEQTDDLFAVVDGPFAAAPSLRQFDYTTALSAGIFETLAGSVSATAVPEPGAVALLVAGLVLSGVARRRV